MRTNNRFTSSKLEHMLSIQKSPLDKTGLDFEDSISVPKTHSINFVSSFKPPMSEIVKPVEDLLRRPRLILKSLSLRILPFLRISCMIDLCGFVIFVERLGTFVQTVSSCKLLSEQISQKYTCLKHKIMWYLLVS